MGKKSRELGRLEEIHSSSKLSLMFNDEDWEHLHQEANHYMPFWSADLEQVRI